MPPEAEWFANLTNPNTKRGYENAVGDFVRFTGINRPEEFRTVTRAHIIAWRDDLVRRGLGGSTIRHRLVSLASLFEYLCEKNAVTHSPVKDGERPKAESSEGKTPAIGDHQASKLLDAPQAESIKSTPGTNAKACRISRCPARAARPGICRCIPGRPRSSTITLRSPGTAPMKTVRCSGQ